MSLPHFNDHIPALGSILTNPEKPLKQRFRALFTLRAIGGQQAIDAIALGFKDQSELLKHECAYCLGQLRDPYADSLLKDVLSDSSQQVMVRHEAAEALGAIGSPSSLPLLQKYSSDALIEVAETCQIAVKLIQWRQNQQQQEEVIGENPFESVDPAPPLQSSSVEELREILLNENKSLFERYRALFSLRNLQTKEAVLAIVEGLKGKSALFRHEIAYVLGQLQHPASISGLKEVLENTHETAMVRHECAEALGSIGTEDVTPLLNKYSADLHTVVRESCLVALDMVEYENSNEFQYANGLVQI